MDSSAALNNGDAMKKDKEVTKVIFKMARYSDGSEEEVLAFFPGASANRGNVMSYAHVGQHGEASYDFFLENCRQCSEKEYLPLKKELEKLFGYRFKIVKRITRKDLEEAWRRT